MNNQQYSGDDSDLKDYIRVMIKRKKIILAIFFVFVITTVVVNFCTPEVYKISMVVEPANFGVTDAGDILYIGSAENIRTKIKEGIFDSRIIRALDYPLKNTRFKFSTPRTDDPKLIKVSIEQTKDKMEAGLKILNQLFNELSNSYKDIIESKKNGIEKQISLISNNIISKNNEIKLCQEQLRVLQEREAKLVEEVKETKFNAEKLISERDVLLDKREKRDNISSLLYTATIQHGIAYFNQLNNQLFDLRTQKEGIVNEIKNIQSEINNLKIEIEHINLKKESIVNIKLVQEPEVLWYPIKPKIKQNIAVSAVFGVMLGIFSAFFQEFWQKSMVDK